MPRLAANLNWLYPEFDFPERFAKAAGDGFRGVEIQIPYVMPAAEVRARLTDNNLQAVLINAPSGDAAAGERGFAAVPGREAVQRESFGQALAYASAMGCPRIHLMAGLVPAGEDRARCRETFLRNLAWAAKDAASAGVTVLVEPINPRDIPGYFLNRQDEAHAICAEVGAANLRVQMDLYHCQVVEGDLATKIRQYLPGVGHFQVAGVPSRQEPDQGEVNYPFLFQLIDELGYDGWVGAEYRPRAATSAGLGWAMPWLA